jgi:uncharacterized membrane protein YhaH (DUF805 family)
MLQSWFGFTGRIHRARFWRISAVAFTLLFIALAAIFGGMNPATLATFVVLSVAGWWLAFSAAVRRLHDRAKSGWWCIALCVGPFVMLTFGQMTGIMPLSFLFAVGGYALAIWGIVELGFRRGTAGPNRFGPDPLENRPPGAAPPQGTALAA